MPVLKSIMTFDGGEIENYHPELAHNFHVQLHLSIGPSGQPGGHDYTLGVCTPTWLEHAVSAEGRPMWGRHLLIVNSFDAAWVRQSIERRVAGCSGLDWPVAAERLARYFAWEFEDYSNRA